MTTPILSSYDDLIAPTALEICFESVMKWITSCKDFSQMNAAGNAVKLFRKLFPKEQAKAQTLFRTYWRLKREFIND